MQRRILTLALILGLSGSMWAQKNPSQADQLFQAGQDELKAGRYKEALDSFKKANKLRNNTCADCYINMAVAWVRMGQMENAVANCDKAISTATDSGVKATAHSMRGTVLMGLGRNDAANLKDAEAEYRAAIELDGNEPVFHMNLAMALLRQSKDEEAKDQLQRCLALHPDGQVAEHANLLLANPRLGRANLAPEFHITTLQGQELSLKQLGGNIVVLDFWATWCPPCRESVSELRNLTRKYADSKLVVISISADKDEKAWREFIAKKKMDWPQYLDTNNDVISSFNVHAFPTYVVIDGDGVVKQRITGMNPHESVVHRLKATLEMMPQLEGVASK